MPTDQGFDEWWGYRNSVDEAGWTSYATFEAIAKAKGIQAPQLWEGKKGGTQTAVRELNVEVRPLLDELIVEKTTDFITRQAASRQAVLHLRRAVSHASAGGGAPGLRPDVVRRGWGSTPT